VEEKSKLIHRAKQSPFASRLSQIFPVESGYVEYPEEYGYLRARDYAGG
jgi:hypothetical protein